MPTISATSPSCARLRVPSWWSVSKIAEHKAALTPHERIKAAYLHYVRGIDQHDIAVAFEVNPGRINEACRAIWEAVQPQDDPSLPPRPAGSWRMNRDLEACELRHYQAEHDKMTAQVEALSKVLAECADDLEAGVGEKYDGSLGIPSLKLKYERDMEPVIRARAALNAAAAPAAEWLDADADSVRAPAPAKQVGLRGARDIAAGRTKSVDSVRLSAPAPAEHTPLFKEAYYNHPAPAEREKAKLPMKRCDECDNGIEEYWLFCPWCGHTDTLPNPLDDQHDAIRARARSKEK